MSQASVSVSSVASPSGKRKIGEVERSTSVDPSPKFSKSNASNKVVPTVVAVDMGSPVSEQPVPQQQKNEQQEQQQALSFSARVAATAATATPKERVVANRLDWKLINNRAALERVLVVQKMVFKPQKGGASYIAVDTAAYKDITGQHVQLGEHNHFKVRGPYMLNIWGISSQEVGGNVSHSVAFDIKDGSKDFEVQEFAQFLALVDDVILSKCVALSINSKEIRDSVQWVDFCKNEENGEINVKKLRSVVAKNYQGALRCSKTSKSKPDFVPVTFASDSDTPIISDAFFFKTKIRGKRNNNNLLDLSCFTVDNKPVFYGLVKELEEERATYIQADFEMPAINFVGKTFYSTWVTRKIKYQLKGGEGEQQEENTDMDGNIIPQSNLDMLARQEQEYLANKADGMSDNVPLGADDDGGF